MPVLAGRLVIYIFSEFAQNVVGVCCLQIGPVIEKGAIKCVWGFEKKICEFSRLFKISTCIDDKIKLETGQKR